MQSTKVSPPSVPSPSVEPDGQQRRNLALLAVHQIIFRVGWLFKTESVIVPAFLDHIAGAQAGMLRGCLPVLSRVGQGVMPIFFTGHVEKMGRKKFLLGLVAACLGVPFLIAGLCCQAGAPTVPRWLPFAFLGLYFLFASLNGLYQLLFGTVQGKLISATRRGLLLTLSTFWGTLPAILIGLWLLPRWLSIDAPNYAAVFLAANGFFVVAGFLALGLREPREEEMAQPDPGELRRRHHNLRVLWHTVTGDAALRRLLLVAVLFSIALVLVPHYQAMARQRWQLGGTGWVLWVVTQSASVGIFSVFVGRMADRRGNRLTLRLLILGTALGPIFVLLLTQLPDAIAASAFWLVFIPLGFSPLALRVFFNYTLELVHPEAHPRYLACVQLALVLPLVFSPAIGWAIDVVGFEPIYFFAAVTILVAGLLTFRLSEPRYAVPSRPPTATIGDQE